MVTKTIGPSGSGADYVCDGIADEVQFNQAMSYLNGLGGGKAVLLDGQYNFAANALTVTIPRWCELLGEHNPNIIQDYNAPSCRVPQVRITNPSVAAFTLLAGATVRQIQAYYPNQVMTGTPNAYQPLFELGSPTPNFTSPITLEYIHALNPFILFRATPYTGSMCINHIRGFPIYKGIQIDNCGDFSHLSDVSFSPCYGTLSNDFPWGLRAWQYANSIMFDFSRFDGMHISDCLFFVPASIGIRLGNGQTGCSWGHVQGVHVEGPKNPLVVGGVSQGTQFNNLSLWATTLNDALQPTYSNEDGITIQENASDNSFNNLLIVAGRHGINAGGSGYNLISNGKIQGDGSNNASNSAVHSTSPGQRLINLNLYAGLGRSVYFGATDSEIIGNFLHSLGGAHSVVSGNIAIGNHVRYGPMTGTWSVNVGNLP